MCDTSSPNPDRAGHASAPASVNTQAMQDLAVRWTEVQPSVAAFIASLLPDYHASQEVLGRTAATLVAKHERYDPTQPFIAWAIGLARIEALRYRSERANDRHVFDEQTVLAVAEAYQRVEPEAGDIRQALQDCLKKLRGRTREVFAAHFGQSLSLPQIAERIGITLNAVNVALHRGRAGLRNCIQQRLAAERRAP